MENAIKLLRIQNFKSIKDVTLHPRRVNLIIGEPNVGKSNLLEAMSLLGAITYEQTAKFMGSFIRYEEPRQLFYDNLVAHPIKVETDRDVAVLLFEKKDKKFKYLFINAEFYNSLSASGQFDDVGIFPNALDFSIIYCSRSGMRKRSRVRGLPPPVAERFSRLSFHDGRGQAPHPTS